MAATVESMMANMDQLCAKVAEKSKGKPRVKAEPRPKSLSLGDDVIDLTSD